MREETYEERRKTCGKCVCDGEGFDISGSTCYLCKRNPVDHRIDWFEEKKDGSREYKKFVNTINSFICNACVYMNNEKKMRRVSRTRIKLGTCT